MASIGWKTATSGNWTTAADWTGGAVPGSGDDVTLGLSGGYAVSITSPITTVSTISITNSSATLLVQDVVTGLTSGDFTNSGTFDVDTNNGGGGSDLTIGGILTNSGTVNIGTSNLSAATTVVAGGLSNTGALNLTGSASKEAILDITTAAPATWTGTANLFGNALLEFASGGITSIASGGKLVVGAADAYVADAGTTGSDSALTGLDSVAGTFELDYGAAVSLSGGLTVTGTLNLDTNNENDENSSLAVAGDLTNSGTINIADSSGLQGGESVTIAGALDNTGTIDIDDDTASATVVTAATLSANGGSINLVGDHYGHGSGAAELIVTSGAAPSTLGSTLTLFGPSLVEFASGGITSIASGGKLVVGAADAYVADAGTTGSDSALTGLDSVAGTFELDYGAAVSLSGGLTVTGTLNLDTNNENDENSSLAVAGDLTNSGTINIADSSGLQGGESVTIAGALDNTGTIDIDDDTASATVVTAATLSANGGSINLVGDHYGHGSGAAELIVTSGAAPSTLNSTLTLFGPSLVEFASGGITSIASGGKLVVGAADAYVADAGTTGSDSALTGLDSVAGTFELDYGAAVSLSGGLTVTGTLNLDTNNENDENSSLAVAGDLTNSGTINIADSSGLQGGESVTIAGALDNTGTIDIDDDTASATVVTAATLSANGGSINLVGDHYGHGSGAAELIVTSGAAPSTLGSTLTLFGPSLVEFASGGITSIASGGKLVVGAADAYVADAGTTGSDSALVGLDSVAGTFELDYGAAVSLSGGLTVTGTLNLDTNNENDENSSLAVAGDLTNSGTINIADSSGLQGGESVTIAGALDNTGTIDIDDDTASATVVTAATLSANGGSINLVGDHYGHGSGAAELIVTSGAAPATLNSTLTLFGPSLVEFASGGITSIASGGKLVVGAADAYVADAGTTGSDSALTGLDSVAGTFELDYGAAVSLSGGLTVTGTLNLDTNNENDENSSLAVAGDLTNSGTINIADSSGLQGGESVTIAGALDNTGTIDIDDDTASATVVTAATLSANGGSINLVGDHYGHGSGAAELIVTSGAAPSTLGSTLTLFGPSLVEFASGGITSIASGGKLVVGAADAYVADAGTTGSDSALVGLDSVAGTFELDYGAAVSLSGGLTVTGTLNLDTNNENDENSSLAVAGDLTNSGTINIADSSGLQGGESVTIAGALDNTGTIDIDDDTASATVVTAATLSANGGSINLVGDHYGHGSGAAELIVTSGAAPATLNSTLTLFGPSLVEFASGGITSIASGGKLVVGAADAYVADAGTTGSDSALVGLDSVAGTFELDYGAAVSLTGGLTVTGTLNLDTNNENDENSSLAVAGDLTNSGTINIADNNYTQGGESVTIAGALDNTGTIDIDDDTASATVVTAATLSANGGSINLVGDHYGHGSGAAELIVTSGAAPSTLNSTLTLFGPSLVEFASGGITSIASGGKLVVGAADAYVADAGTTGSDSALVGLDSVAGTFELDYGAAVSLTGGLTVTGTLNLDTNNENDENSSLAVAGDLTNSGTINIADNNYTQGGESVTIAGALDNTGTIDIDDDTASATVVTAATLSANGGSINLVGDRDGDGSAPAELIVNGAATVSGNISLNAYAKLEVTGGNTFTQTSGTVTVGGTLAAAAIDLTGGLMDFTAAVTAGEGTGNFALGGNATLDFAGAVDAGHTITFTSTSARLDLGTPGLFAPTMDGFAIGDTIDLLKTAVTGLSYAGGVLAVTNGSSTVATLNLSGGYTTSEFVFASDKNGGTDIQLASNPAQAAIEQTGGAGTITASGNSYTLNLGTVAFDTTAPTADLEVLNNAVTPSATLSGSFTVSGGNTAFTNTGFAAFSGLAAGQADTGLTVALATGAAGTFSETITLAPASNNAAGSTPLATETLTIMGTVAPPQSGTPSISAPSAAVVGVDQVAAISGVSLSESPTTSGETFTVTLADSSGLLSATGTGVSGAGTTSLTVSGSLTQVNTDLATLTDTENSTAPDTIRITASDSNGGTAGPAQIAISASGALTLAVPSAATLPFGQTTAISGVALSESPTTPGETFTVTLSDATGALAATGSGVSGSGTTSLTISGSLAQVNADLATLTDTEASTAVDAIAIDAGDSDGGTASGSIALTITGLPAIAAPGTANVARNVATVITGIGVSVSQTTAGETFTVQLSDNNGNLSAAGSGATLTGAGTTVLTIEGTLAAVNAALATVTDDDPIAGADKIVITAGDSNGGTSPTAFINVEASGTPAITAPPAATVGIAQADAITGISLSEANTTVGETFAVTVTDATGILSANGAEVTGTGTTGLAIIGTLDQVNAALATLSVTEPAIASDTIVVNAGDSDGGKAAPANILVTVNGVPVIAAPSGVAVQEGVASPIGGISLSEPGNTAGETFTVALGDVNGLLSASGAGVSGAGTTSLSITGSLAQVNSDLATLTDTEAAAGSDTIAIGASDSNGESAAPALVGVTIDGPAQPAFEQVSGLGTLTQTGANAWTLDLDTIALNSGPVTVGFGVANVAPSPTDLLTGTLTASGSSEFTNSGLDPFSTALGPDTAPQVTLATNTAGPVSETVTLAPLESGPSGYQAALSDVTLTVEADVEQLPPPVITAPSSQTVFTGMAAVLGPLNVTDPNPDNGGILTAVLSAGAGTLAANKSGGGAVSGSGSSNLVLTGDLSDLNAELAAVTYTGTTAGNDTVTMTVTDDHNASATQDIAITDEPVPVTGPVLSAPEQELVITGTSTGLPGFNISDPYAEATGQQLTFTLSTTEAGIDLTASGDGGTVTGSGTGTLTITGTVSQIDSYFADEIGLDELYELYETGKKITTLVNAGVTGETVNEAEFFPGESAFLAIGIDAVTFGIQSLISLVPGNGPAPSYEEFEEKLWDILAGDPNMVTYSGQIYHFDAAGEFILTGSTQPGNSFQVQVRLQPLENSSVASVITQIAASVGNDRVTVGIGRTDPVWVDGNPAALSGKSPITLSGGEISQISPDSYQIVWNTGEVLTRIMRGRVADVV